MTDFSGRSILLAEDEPIVAMMVEDMLLDLGARVIGPAASVGKALDLARAGGIDAAVLDVNLNGETCHPIVDVLRAAGVPMVVATGYDQPDLGDRTGIELIQKPYRREHLAAAVERALAASRSAKV
ncbi:MAG TPA: response regulator [Azospirillaceae bacterium]|nr:response regulator [Azospirillaceae bacterium]